MDLDLPTKSFLQSNTIRGLLVIAAAWIARTVGFELSPEAIGASVNDLLTIAGLVWAIYGRFTAKTRLTL